MNSKLGQAMGLMAATKGKDRLRMASYLFVNLLSKVFKMPARQREMTVRMEGLLVTFKTFSAQLGAYTDIFREKIYERLPGFRARPGDVIVDAGANVGFYTLYGARAVGPKGRVYAFEPNPEVFELLKRNAAQNGFGWVFCHPSALSSEEGDVFLTVSSRKTSTAEILRIGKTSGGFEVKSTTLDSFVLKHGITQIDILKMDTEGAETDIVKGGIERALPITKRVVMESHNTRYPVRDVLAPLGFGMVLDDRETHTVYFEKKA